MQLQSGHMLVLTVTESAILGEKRRAKFNLPATGSSAACAAVIAADSAFSEIPCLSASSRHN